MTTIALIACCKSKSLLPDDRCRVPAAQLYTGQLFRVQLAYAGTALNLPIAQIFIASAKYGLLELDKPVASYEQTLAEMMPEARQEWARQVVDDLLRYFAKPQPVYLLAGGLYRQALTPPLTQRGIEAVDPVAGLGLGYARQAQWYKQQVEARRYA